MVCMCPRAGSSPTWSGCWRKRFAIPPIGGWLNICAMKSRGYSPFCTVPAERALRPAVVARKTWGGNRTENGAKTQQILISILTTCHQQGKDSFDRIAKVMFSPTPIVLDLIPNSS